MKNIKIPFSAGELFRLALLLIMLGALIYLIFFHKKKQESSWAPIYRDPNKELIAMRGMANESNSVAGMIGNPVLGAMKHKGVIA